MTHVVSLKPHKLSQEVSANIIYIFNIGKLRLGAGDGEITFQELTVRKGQSQGAVMAKTP